MADEKETKSRSTASAEQKAAAQRAEDQQLQGVDPEELAKAVIAQKEAELAAREAELARREAEANALLARYPKIDLGRDKDVHVKDNGTVVRVVKG